MPDILVPERLLKKIEKVLEKLDKEEDYITEEEAAKYLGVSKRTLQNLIYKKTISPSQYRVAVTGKRMFQKSKLLV